MLTTYWKRFTEQGCFYRLVNDVLVHAPMHTNGGMDHQEAADVDFYNLDAEEAAPARKAKAKLIESLNCCGVYMANPKELFEHLKTEHAPFEFEYAWILQGGEGGDGDPRPIVCDACNVRAGDECQCPRRESVQQRIRDAVSVARDDFWVEIAKQFPEAKSGDFPPDAHFTLTYHLREAVRVWLRANTDLLAKE